MLATINQDECDDWQSKLSPPVMTKSRQDAKAERLAKLKRADTDLAFLLSQVGHAAVLFMHRPRPE